MVQGPFPLLNSVLKGLCPPEGIAQKATAQRWYAYLGRVSQLLHLRKGSVMVSKFQQPANPDVALLGQPYTLFLIKEAPELSAGSDMPGVWFTDASACRIGSKWQYKAAALEMSTGKSVTEEGEGSAQVGELRALLLAVENGTTAVYTDSYAAYKGATEWICQQEYAYMPSWDDGKDKIIIAPVRNQQVILDLGLQLSILGNATTDSLHW